MKYSSMKAMPWITVAITVLILATSTSAIADPPKSTCKFRIYNCGGDASCPASVGELKLDINVFNGNDSAKIWAYYEHRRLPEKKYTSARCNHANCDITVWNRDDRASGLGEVPEKGLSYPIKKKENHCGDIYAWDFCGSTTGGIAFSTNDRPYHCRNTQFSEAKP